VTTCRFLDRQAFAAVEAERVALAKRRGDDAAWKEANKAEYGWASLAEITGPCVMWLAHWYYDHDDPQVRVRRDKAIAAIVDGSFGRGEKNYYLSRYYWQQWSDRRPPICVLCPNGREWCVDAKSRNGDGWMVTGDPPLITCEPSIQVPGYHGFLRNGVFTPNM
jgi:hypothetical protein